MVNEAQLSDPGCARSYIIMHNKMSFPMPKALSQEHTNNFKHHLWNDAVLSFTGINSTIKSIVPEYSFYKQ